MTTKSETRPIYEISNDYYALDIGMKHATLMEMMKMFLSKKKKIPTRLLTDLKEVKKQNKKRETYTLHTDCKNTQHALKMYYKQYKHLDKYYPKNLDKITPVGSLQRGERAVDIEKKYENLIRQKVDSHIWVYHDEGDRLSWIKPELFRKVKKGYSKSEIERTKKIDFSIGDVKWYGIILEDGEGITLNYGLTALANKMIWGFTAVFDDTRSRDDYYDWIRR
jgi:hypothetical protein